MRNYSNINIDALVQNTPYFGSPLEKPQTPDSLAYLIDETGLIPESRTYKAVKTCALELYLKNPKMTVDDIFEMMLDILNPMLYRQGKPVFSPKDNQFVASQKTGWFSSFWHSKSATFKQMITEEVADAFQNLNQAKLQTMFNNREPNAAMFLETCKKFWPNINASCVGQAATSLSKYIENILSNLNVPDAHHQNVMLYLYSEVGGTGKGTTMRRFEHWAKSRNLPVASQTSINSKWVGPEFATSYIATVNEFFPIKSQETEAIVNVNNIVDNENYISEKKCVQPVQLKSVSSIMVGSNVLPYDKNARRYALVQFNQKSLLRIKDEDKKYFPDRTPEEWDAIIDDLFKYCVFGADYTTYDNRTYVNPQLMETISWLQEIVPDMPDATNITPAALVQFAATVDPSLQDARNRKNKRRDIVTCLNSLMESGLDDIQVQRVNGSTEYSHYDFTKIASLEVGEKARSCQYDSIHNVFQATDTAWDDLISLFRCDDPVTDCFMFPDPEEDLPIEETAYGKTMIAMWKSGKLDFLKERSYKGPDIVVNGDQLE